MDPVAHATTESYRIPATSPNPGSTRARHRIVDTSTRTTHFSIPEPSALTSTPKSNSKASPLDPVAVGHTADTCAPSAGLDVPLSASATPVLCDISESQMSILASASPFASPPPSTSAPDLRVPAEDESNAKAGMRKDAPRTSFTITAVPNPPPQSPLAAQLTGVAIAGPSRRSFDAEHTGDHPTQSSYGR